MVRDHVPHRAERARIQWRTVAGCDHEFGGAVGVCLAPDDVCARCGATREQAATVQGYLRHLGRKVPWGGPA